MIDLNDTYWERVVGVVTELRVDARWILKQNETEKPYGSLRIASHPDLKAGHLRAVFTYVEDIREKSKSEKIQTVEDYQIDPSELEIYSINEDIKTTSVTIVAPYQELNKKFGVSIFG